MTSPVIDEAVMLEALSTPGGTHVRSGATMLVLDAYDRKVTRDQFIATLGAVVTLLDAVSKQEMMLNVKDFYKDKGAVTAADIEMALLTTNEALNVGCAQCVKIAELLQKCPFDEDKVH